MIALDPILKKAYWSLASLGGIYAVFIIALLNPWIQHHALYAHKIHSGFWHDLNQPESFGFARNQITPFNLSTPDGETLYCWHILPIDAYAAHEREITRAPGGPADNFTTTVGYKLLKEDPESRIVINFHGNAGHLAQGWRTSTYSALASLPHTHTLACDYRGFGFSTGRPSEPGILTDSIALTHYALTSLAQPASRTVLLGQSLGTSVAAGVALHFSSPSTLELPFSVTRPAETLPPQSFAGIVLIASFPSLPELLTSYRIRGVLPILAPLRPYPRIGKYVEKWIVDTWPTAARLTALVAAAKEEKLGLRLSVLHARDDPDINWKLGEKVFEALEKEMLRGGQVAQTEERRSVIGVDRVSRGAFVYRAVEDVVVGGADEEGAGGRGRFVELEIVRYGGHNRVVTYTPVMLAVKRAFASV
ncbi:alpha/beta-hydrolase [Mytilinidion resinicola]|uniref:Alpha/beta-hydrolase n=1 Tax=Mytilinidion resinicola TaxID=574789 RepID=A0A6A6Z169_9PEZI|nr:alpha/beta-hydrolase [Mytilinidion resinicola]KAF2814906.1 alpha/beta-hydrolase [Mytilinidion resinicola]